MALAATGFVVPFMFVYGPPLLLDGTVMEIGLALATALVGVTGLAAAIIGQARRPLRAWQRVALGGAACLLIFPGWWTDALGLLGVAVFMLPGGSRERSVSSIEQ
jgi:TRAP-type uncharacterized transport system fused permease subunit